jgi:hypothetical protein
VLVVGHLRPPEDARKLVQVFVIHTRFTLCRKAAMESMVGRVSLRRTTKNLLRSPEGIRRM